MEKMKYYGKDKYFIFFREVFDAFGEVLEQSR